MTIESKDDRLRILEAMGKMNFGGSLPTLTLFKVSNDTDAEIIANVAMYLERLQERLMLVAEEYESLQDFKRTVETQLRSVKMLFDHINEI